MKMLQGKSMTFTVKKVAVNDVLPILSARKKKVLSENEEFIDKQTLESIGKALKKAKSKAMKLDAGAIKWLGLFSKLDKPVRDADAPKTLSLLKKILNTPISSSPIQMGDNKRLAADAKKAVAAASKQYDEAIDYVSSGFGEFDMVVLHLSDAKDMMTVASYLYQGNLKKAYSIAYNMDTVARDELVDVKSLWEEED